MYSFIGSWNSAVFWGFLVALSSTAIVLKILSDKAEVDSFHGRIMVGMLIFQDICLIPMMFMISVLSGEKLVLSELFLSFLKALFIVVLVFISGRLVVPRLLFYAVATKSRELFIITIILLCLSIAIITSKFGLSLAIGAFLAGLILSESEYAHQALAEILPLKELFLGLFFVSVGMLMDISYASSNLISILTLFLMIIVVKVFITTIVILLQKYPLKTAIYVGLGLAQIGEFSFVMAGVGKFSNLMPTDEYQLFLSASVLSMLSAPFILMSAPFISERIGNMFSPKEEDISSITKKKADIKNHVIIVGYGLIGSTLAKVLKEVNIPYVVVELNIKTVQSMKNRGEPIYYGDATTPGILHEMNIQEAEVLVVAINAPAALRKIVELAKKENPDLHIIVRTRYIMEVEELKAAGADEVIAEEFEASIEIFAKTLNYYQFPYNLIIDMVNRIRSDSYRALRGVDVGGKHLFESCTTFPCEIMPEIHVQTYIIGEDSPYLGKSLKEMDLRAETGATIIAVRRDGRLMPNPGADFRLVAGDVLFLTGDREAIRRAIAHLEHHNT
ncbi:MAG: hypothetical protein D6828_02480 [Nitrospirae bacterium]|nr:MAG: hypothetical protein D6828_02480 [Nitrospirota bacterium]